MTILDNIKNGENRRNEFKEKLPKHDQIAKTVVAFSNGAGGKLIIGIEDQTNKVVGLSDDDVVQLPDQISNIIYDSCYPIIIPEIYSERIGDQTVLVVEVFPGPLKPYYLKNKKKLEGTYIRIGPSNRVADHEMMMELERQKRNISFDEEVIYDLNEAAVDFEKLQNDFHEYTGKELTRRDLFNLKLLSEVSGTIYPTKAGLLLAGRKENQPEYARVKSARFQGNKTEEFIDQKEFQGPLYTQVEEAMKFAKMYIAKSGKIEGIQRHDRYEVPLIAIREALINAVVHRDYSVTGSDIKFAIFDNRIEIVSPGVLPKTLDINDIIVGRSEIRNKVIARFFNEIGFIEQWGTGIQKMISACREAGIEMPQFIESGYFFKVVIFKANQLESDYSEEVHAFSGDKVAKSSDKKQNGSDKVNGSEQIILEYLEDYAEISNQTVRELTGLSQSGARKVLSKLNKKGFVEAIGERRGRTYRLKKD